MADFIISAFADEACREAEGQIKALKRNGIYNIEPRFFGGAILDKTDEELYAFKKMLDENGIGVPSIGSPIGKYGIYDDFDAYIPKFERALQACHILGASKMRIFSFFVKPEDYDKCRPEVLRRMNILLDMAEVSGVTLCHENESRIYGQNPDRVKDLFDNLPRLRGIFDAANYIMNDCDVVEGLEVTLPHLGYVHVKDAEYRDKLLWPVGQGDGQYEKVLESVNESTDGTVILTLEPHLYVFESFKKIDSHNELNTGLSFNDPDTAFDFAATSLKTMLYKLGYSEKENHVWKK